MRWIMNHVIISKVLTHCIETVLLHAVSRVWVLVSTVSVLFLTALILLDMTENVLNPTLNTVFRHGHPLQYIFFIKSSWSLGVAELEELATVTLGLETLDGSQTACNDDSGGGREV